ncbi:hypothetical protein TVAG_170530 [Trichomonas vaginalis G3]|uniref:Uncharacterized protein n=1 Tax=Trichomonas vaginalis (strain ATCC PRA-98 / G3) TaxID=412133 RepID=A2DPJ5_TRIV3|nr:hypothetical protein TVAGG3_0680120 [Trichomonas vaginalis G3]EAY17739.1 hypothetical protein TVAG_170530 [Trichomonas vaginalis G3]KAI5507844.1 hypothetical protein TVAGG3_0680120 [Trichomonas vaginalis G3]|eukprot:XP_001329874.1 hypothetical protein [Trichomonas vaginalis G3]
MIKTPYDTIISNAIDHLNERNAILEQVKKVIVMFSYIVQLLKKSEDIEFHRESMPPQISQLLHPLQEWLRTYIAHGSCFHVAMDQVESILLKSLNEFQHKIFYMTTHIRAASGDSKARLEIVEKGYTELYQKYIDKCHEIEAEQDINVIDKLKSECLELEKKCYNSTTILGKSRRSYCFEIEVLLTNYETIIEKFQKVMQNSIDSIIKISQVIHLYFNSIKLNRETLQSCVDAQRRSSDELKPRPVGKKLSKIPFISPIAEITFNIFNYIDPKYIYESALSAQVYEAKETYSADEYNVFMINPGDYVTCIGKKGKNMIVEIVGSGLRGEVPSDKLVKTDFKRYLVKLIEFWEEKEVMYPVGFVLCVCKQTNESLICLTPSQVYVNIPPHVITD